MHHLSIRIRMLIILVNLLIPIGMLSYQLGTKLNEDINFANAEIDGLIYEKPTLKLLDEIADYQVNALRQQAGDADAAKDMAEGEQSIDKLFAELGAIDQKIGESLGFTVDALTKHKREDITAPTLARKWQNVKANPHKQELYNELLGNLEEVIKHLGDTSNMILNPELDSYYLADLSINVLPATLKKLAQVKAGYFILLAANDNQIPAEKRSDVLLDAQVVKDSFLDRTRNNIETSISSDADSNGVSATLKQNLEPELAKYSEGANNLITAMTGLAKGQSMDGTKFIEIGDVMHDGTAELGQTALDEFNTLLNIRLGVLKEKRLYTLGGCGALVLLSFIVFVYISGTISGPIKRMTDAMKRLADGDKSVEIPSTDHRDEIGAMAKTVLVFKSNMLETDRLKEEQEKQKLRAEEDKKAAMHQLATNFERDVKGIVNIVASAATELSQTAQAMTKTISSSAQMAVNASSAASQTSSNVQSVASAAEELSASVREISGQLQKTTQLVSESTEKAQNADKLAAALGAATSRVNEVMGMISNIAGQINLLALNATIESARAGEAGKGFAVVASEVKNLAGQTDKSIAEIQSVIEEMRSASDAITHALEDIRSSVTNISGAATTVASAVEEQSATTNEIAKSMQTAAQGTQVISSNLDNVSSSSAEAGTAAGQMLTASQELSRQAEGLSTQVDAFLSKIRAA